MNECEEAFIAAARQMIEPYRPAYWQLLRCWQWYIEMPNFEIECKLWNIPWLAVTMVNLGVPEEEVVAVQMALFNKTIWPINYQSK